MTRTDYLQDLTDHLLLSRRNKGLVTPTTGVTRPFARGGIESVEDMVNMTKGWMFEQKARRGGSALDMSNTRPSATYAQRRFDFISKEEGTRTRAYDDRTGLPIKQGREKKGLVTVGIGFNMERPDVLNVWKRATGLGKKEFDEVKAGRLRLSEEHVRSLFDHTVQEAESIVQNKFGDLDLKEHQRMALVSLAFNNPSLIGPNLTKAVREGNLREVRDEILQRSNRSRSRGIAKRRYREAAMFVGPMDSELAMPQYLDYLTKFA